MVSTQNNAQNMNKIITGVFMHNFSTPVNDKNEIKDLIQVQMHKNHVSHIEYLGFISQSMFKYSIRQGQYARTSVPVPSTCTKKENQALFKEKQKKHIKCEICPKNDQNRIKIKRYTQGKNLIKVLEQSYTQCHLEHLHNLFSIFGVFYDFI